MSVDEDGIWNISSGISEPNEADQPTPANEPNPLLELEIDSDNEDIPDYIIQLGLSSGNVSAHTGKKISLTFASLSLQTSRSSSHRPKMNK